MILKPYEDKCGVFTFLSQHTSRTASSHDQHCSHICNLQAIVPLASGIYPTVNNNLCSPQNWGEKAVLQKTYKNAKSFNSDVLWD